MDRKQMEEIARKRAPKRPLNINIPDNKGATGQDALMLILGSRESEEKPEPQKQTVSLYLRDGVNPADSNFTKYPNDLHTAMIDCLSKEYEGILYIYLWRKSFGYGRNYCRISYFDILENTLISSRKTAQRAVSNLVEKHFIVRAKHEDGTPNFNQQGALYRVFTPKEIQSGISEECISLDDLPFDGVVCRAIPSETTLQNASDDRILQGMASQGVDYPTTGCTGHTLSDHTTMAYETIPCRTTPATNPDNTGTKTRYGLIDHTLAGRPFKEDSLKDTLSPHDIISGFYSGISQSKISKEKRARAEKNFKELQKDGFSIQDIQFAVEWTLKNPKKDFYDFSIIKHTIGEAVAVREKAEAEEAKRLEQEKIALEKQTEEERQEEEKSKLESYKESLSTDEKAKLRGKL